LRPVKLRNAYQPVIPGSHLRCAPGMTAHPYASAVTM
jgi:hypothetical protein